MATMATTASQASSSFEVSKMEGVGAEGSSRRADELTQSTRRSLSHSPSTRGSCPQNIDHDEDDDTFYKHSHWPTLFVPKSSERSLGGEAPRVASLASWSWRFFLDVLKKHSSSESQLLSSMQSRNELTQFESKSYEYCSRRMPSIISATREATFSFAWTGARCSCG
eukprot:CAMPEP_0185713814 /NCGR_PEP_ID=MMETSP1164-20130828/37570_1 /TAXON_ID=1104430 /ORGANISM="Chrysoreinhardia sp, Strain CCMP2950" /LENGTH=166 /DNA_ID=CAMNT_0028381387 /DNA_START=24 /DNA_END=521 /DNA_ORIENTATION=+